MEYNIAYVSANNNPTPTAVQWGNNGLICYASCNAVYIYDHKCGSGGAVTKTLNKHTKRVNSVRWLSDGKSTQTEIELVSGSTDCTAIVWNIETDSFVVLEGHESNVNIVDGLYKGSNYDDAVIATASMDCSVKTWHRKHLKAEFIPAQTLNLGYNICTSLRLSHFTRDTQDVVLAVACDNAKIQIYLESGETAVFDHFVDLQEHTDWVRGLDFTLNGGDLLLASSSQDFTINLWRFTLSIHGNITESIFQRRIEKNNKTYIVFLESALVSHEGWVYSVCWHPKTLKLLSASIDKSMIIWSVDRESNLWMEEARLGEIGGNTLGFYGAVFSPDGDYVLGHSYNGAFHIWERNSNGIWLPKVTVGGHFGPVCDLAWDPRDGEFLVTVSADQTTRIHAPWSKVDKKTSWHEIARPQVHGYDMNALALISRYKFASAAEEKVIRTFQAPKNFVDNFQRLCRIENDVEGDGLLKSSDWEAKGASVPSLGLSNKAVFSDDNIEESQCVDRKNPYPEESHFVASRLDEPPTEETLLENTLWPEIQKLYGHGYEVFALTASPDGKFLASACKSTIAKHAAILLWDTTSWKNVQSLQSHTLTVVQIQFSPDSNHLLSVSRDRRWTLFTKDASNSFQLSAGTEKRTAFHKRIIWCCSWTHDSNYFLTGSRDCKICAWRVDKKEGAEPVQIEALTTNYSVNALTFAPNFLADNMYLFGCGLENGTIILYKWNTAEWVEALKLDGHFSHHLTVNRLAFRPVFGRAGDSDKEKNVLQLASCSADHSVRVYDIYLDRLRSGK